MPHTLIVDDESDAAEMLAALFETEGFTVATAASLRDARRQLALQPPDLVLLDLMLPDGNGIDLVHEVKKHSGTEVVLITGHASVESSVEALRAGAADYLVKPLNIRQLQRVIGRLRRPSTLQQDVDALDEVLERDGHFGSLWGGSSAMRRAYQRIARVAGTGVTVFVTGESGSGKELVARSVHELSRRRSKPFLAVNCGAISPNLIESEIFGHERGSFTGAERQHQGFFERASGGTLFLDEITEMPLDLQVKLLRVLETGTLMRVGSTQTIEIDVRLIAASNRDPLVAVETGKLREDLFFRLNVFPIHVPALRERADDIAPIAAHFLEELCRREGAVKTFSAPALQALSEYAWPGNVRELRNIVQRAYVMASGRTIDDACVPPSRRETARERPRDSAGRDAATMTFEVGTSLAEIEREVTLATLIHFGRHKERTAAALGVSLKTLYNRLKEYAPPGGELR